MIKRSVKIAGICLAGIVVLVAAGIVILSTSPGERFLEGQLESRLAETLGLPVEIDALETNLFSRLVLIRLAVMSDHPARCDTLLIIDSLYIDYSLLPLLSGRLDIGSITTGPIHLCLDRDTLGNFGIAAVDTSRPIDTLPETPSAFDISVGNLDISSITLSYADAPLSAAIGFTAGTFLLRNYGTDSCRFRLDLDSLAFRYDTLPLAFHDLILSGRWDLQELNIDTLTGDFEDLRLMASARVNPGTTELSGDVKLGGVPRKALEKVVAFASLSPMTTNDSLQLTAALRGSIKKPGIAVAMTLPSLTVNDIPLENLALSAALRNDTCTVDSFSVAVFGGNIRARGLAVIDSIPSFQSSLVFHNLGVADIWSTVYHEISPYAGRCGGELTFSGNGSDPAGWDISSAVNASQMRYEDHAIPDFDFDLVYADRVGNLSLRQGATDIRAGLVLAEDSLDGSFTVTIPDIEPLAGLLNFPGTYGSATITGSLNGLISNPHIEADALARNLRYQNIPVDSMTAAISYRDSALFIRDFLAAGNLVIEDSLTAPFGIDSLTGQLAYTVTASGPLADLEGRLTANAAGLTYATFAIDSARIEAGLNMPLADISRLDIYTADKWLHAEARWNIDSLQGDLIAGLHQAGALPDGDTPSWSEAGGMEAMAVFLPDSTIHLEARGRRFRLESLVSFMTDTIVLPGYLDFDLLFNGRPDSPDASLDLALRDMIFPRATLDSITATVDMNGNNVYINNVSVAAEGQKLTGAGILRFCRKDNNAISYGCLDSLAGHLELEDFDIAAVGPLVFPASEISGTLNARLNWAGSSALPNIQGWISLRDGRFRSDTAAVPVENICASLEIKDTVVTVDSTAAVIEEIPVRLVGSMIIADKKRINLDLKADLGGVESLTARGEVAADTIRLDLDLVDFDLETVGPFLSDIDSIDGVVSCHVVLAGSPENPAITGRLALDNFGLYYPRLYTALDNGRIRVSFDKNRIAIDSAMARVNGGTVTLNGYLEHDTAAITDIDLSFRADSIVTVIPDTLTLAVVSADLHYGRQNDNYRLEGDIYLGPTRLTAGVQLKDILPWARSIETVDVEFPDIFERTLFDLRIRESKDIWVDNNLARIRLQADLGIIGSPVRPNFTGRLAIAEGYLLYLDRRFKVSRGTAYFNDPMRFNPLIELTAATRITNYRRMAASAYDITFDAEGPLDQLQVRLTSEPPLDKPDIVALLTLGATRTQLTGKDTESGEGGVKNVLLERAAMLSSRKVSGYVSGKVGSMFGFDEFTVDGNLFNFGDDWGPQLLASRKLSERMEITYTTTIGRRNDQSIRLGYLLTPRLSLQGQTDRYGRSLLDLKYGFKFW